MGISEEKRAEPWNHYDHPRDIEASKSLTKDEKVAMLEAWIGEVEHRLDAANEGMPPHGTTDKDQKLLETLRQLLQRAEGQK